jgi:hypothetical protein
MTDYETKYVFQLLTDAYRPADLLRTCRDSEVLRPICKRVKRDAPMDELADVVIEYCMEHLVLDDLLRIVRVERERQYKRYEPFLKTSGDQLSLVSRCREDAKARDLLLELAEWKLVHNSSQRLVDAVGVPIELLTTCRYRRDVSLSENAGSRWQESCVPKLRGVPDKWNLQYAYSPVLDTLREETSDIDNITRQLYQVDGMGEGFTSVYSRLRELRGTLWDLLTIADIKIMILIDTMQQMVEE